MRKPCTVTGCHFRAAQGRTRCVRHCRRHHAHWTPARAAADQASTILDPTGQNQRPRHRV